MYYFVFEDNASSDILNDAIYNAIMLVEEATEGMYAVQLTDISLTADTPMRDQIVSNCSQNTPSYECFAAAA